MSKDRKQAALDYHAQPGPGKIAISITKPCLTQEDLSLAYTPGVAEPVRALAADPEAAYRYTSKGNLVAAITDASAPTFGGINLEDIAAPHCFTIEEALIERLDIPVFH